MLRLPGECFFFTTVACNFVAFLVSLCLHVVVLFTLLAFVWFATSPSGGDDLFVVSFFLISVSFDLSLFHRVCMSCLLHPVR